MANLADMLVTDADLAELSGLSSRRIRQLVEAGRLTKTGRNRYQLSEVFMALVEELAGGDKSAELTAARVRKVNADADRAELELAKAKAEVAPISEMQSMWASRCVIIRQNMMQLPARVVSQLINEPDERRFKAVLREEIEGVLRAAATADIEIEDYNDE